MEVERKAGRFTGGSSNSCRHLTFVSDRHIETVQDYDGIRRPIPVASRSKTAATSSSGLCEDGQKIMSDERERELRHKAA